MSQHLPLYAPADAQAPDSLRSRRGGSARRGNSRSGSEGREGRLRGNDDGGDGDHDDDDVDRMGEDES